MLVFFFFLYIFSCVHFNLPYLVSSNKQKVFLNSKRKKLNLLFVTCPSDMKGKSKEKKAKYFFTDSGTAVKEEDDDDQEEKQNKIVVL